MTLSVGLYWFTCYVCAWGYWINTYWYSYMIGYTGMFEKGVCNPIYWLLIPMLIVATLGPQVRSNQALSHLPPGFTCTVVHVTEELAPVSSCPLAMLRYAKPDVVVASRRARPICSIR